MHGSMSGHFTCPLVALRFEGTFHVFVNKLAKTFHFCAVGISHMFVYDDNYVGQTSIRGGAPPAVTDRIAPQAAATSATRRAMHGWTSGHFTCPLVALRFEGTFHVFDNKLAKTFHFCAAVYVRLPLTYICAKISRPEQGRILSLIAHCALAQDIKIPSCFFRARVLEYR